jgi:hypothetical protein
MFKNPRVYLGLARLFTALAVFFGLWLFCLWLGALKLEAGSQHSLGFLFYCVAIVSMTLNVRADDLGEQPDRWGSTG